jgi:hypothetical protein
MSVTFVPEYSLIIPLLMECPSSSISGQISTCISSIRRCTANYSERILYFQQWRLFFCLFLAQFFESFSGTRPQELFLYTVWFFLLIHLSNRLSSSPWQCSRYKKFARTFQVPLVGFEGRHANVAVGTFSTLRTLDLSYLR